MDVSADRRRPIKLEFDGGFRNFMGPIGSATAFETGPSRSGSGSIASRHRSFDDEWANSAIAGSCESDRPGRVQSTTMGDSIAMLRCKLNGFGVWSVCRQPMVRTVLMIGCLAIGLPMRTARAVDPVRPDIAARLQPIGAPSAVDRFGSRSAFRGDASRAETTQASRVPSAGVIQQTQFGLPSDLPIASEPNPVPSPAAPFPPASLSTSPTNGGGFPAQPMPSVPTLDTRLPQSPSPNAASPLASPPGNIGGAGAATSPPRRLLPPPSSLRGSGAGERLPPAPAANDRTPMAAPSLGNAFATAGNSPFVSPPGGVGTAMAYPAAQCGRPCRQPCGLPYASPSIVPMAVSPLTYAPVATPPAATPPAATPPVVVPPPIGPPSYTTPGIALPPASAAPAGALVTVAATPAAIEIGQGLLGQPKAYVPGQTFRNWLRYFTP